MSAPFGFGLMIGGASGGGGGGITVLQATAAANAAIDSATDVRTVADAAARNALTPGEGWIAKQADDKSTWHFADGVWELIGYYEIPASALSATHSYEARPDNTAWAPLAATGADGDTITVSYPDGRLIGWKKTAGAWAQSVLQAPALANLLPVRVTANQTLTAGQGYRVVTAGLTLTAPTTGTEFTVANDSGGALRINAPAGMTVEGQTDFVEYASNGVATYSLNGTDWEITEWSTGGGSLTETPLFDIRVTAAQALIAGSGYYVTTPGLTLTAPASGDEFTLSNSSGGTLRVAPSAGQTVGGQTDYVEYGSNGVATFRRNGTDWDIIEWSGPGAPEFYNTPLAAPPTARAPGAQWLTIDTNDHFIWNGTAWIDLN